LKVRPPLVGSVLRYAYLWADQQRRGAEEASKDRPVLVLALAVKDESGETEILVLAVTHSPPNHPDHAVLFPAVMKRAIGLDDEQSWIVTTEANAFIWPGPDLRPIPERQPPTAVYGTVPAALMKRVAISYLANRKRQSTRMVVRTE
jgi:hypothetical protein